MKRKSTNTFYAFFAWAMFCLLPTTAHEMQGWVVGAAKDSVRQEQIHKIQTVVIDPGHGGKDSGSLGSNAQEKDIALKIALQVGEYINTYIPEVEVIYTRETDKFIPLDQRAQIAHDNDADVFISIHCNSLPKRNTKIYGTETYVMGLHRAEENLQVAKRENEVVLMEDNYKEKYGGYDPNSPEAHIILSMYQNAYLTQSVLLADKIEHQFKNRAKRNSRGVKQAGFMVLRQAAMPSVLIETGFLSNPTEETYLRSEKGQVYIASAIYRAFREYKKEVEKGSNSNSNTDVTIAKKDRPNVIFKVQLGSSKKAIDTYVGRWQTVKGLQQEKVDGWYKYMVGDCTSVSEAVDLQKYWRSRGFSDAFVVAYAEGKRVTISEAKALLGQ